MNGGGWEATVQPVTAVVVLEMGTAQFKSMVYKWMLARGGGILWETLFSHLRQTGRDAFLPLKTVTLECDTQAWGVPREWEPSRVGRDGV